MLEKSETDWPLRKFPQWGSGKISIRNSSSSDGISHVLLSSLITLGCKSQGHGLSLLEVPMFWIILSQFLLLKKRGGKDTSTSFLKYQHRQQLYLYTWIPNKAMWHRQAEPSVSSASFTRPHKEGSFTATLKCSNMPVRGFCYHQSQCDMLEA